MSALFALGFFAATFIPNPPIEVNSSANNLLAETRQAYPVLSANSTSQLTAQGSQLVLSEASINARFTGLLSHVRWLIDQQSKSGSHSSTNSSSHSSGGVDAALFSRQIESLSDDIGDSHRDLLEQLNTIVGVTTDSVTPSSVLSIGKVDEDCLTYEATGDTWEWQTCGTGGSNFATTSINTSLKLASIVTDETGTGALVFAGSPTLTGTLTATNANFSGNIGVGTSTPLAVLDIYKSFNGGTKVNVTNKNLGSSVYSEINLTAGTSGASWGVNNLATDNGSTYLVAGKELQLYAGANGAVYLNNTTGNFGISSSSPSAKLTVQNTGTGNSFIIEDQAGDTTPFVIDSNGRVGIGTANPFINNKVNIESNSSDFAHFGLGTVVEGDPLIANSRYGGVDTYVTSKAGNNTNMLYIFGVGSGAAHNGNGVLQELQGNYSYIESTGSGTVTNAMAYDATAYNTSNTSTLSNLTYFKAGNLINNGTITNTYGVYVGDITAGTQTNTPYSFYASDNNAYNYFAGNVGIGTTTPVQKLQVFGNIRVGTTGSNGCLENFGGGVIAGTCSSDEELKENITPLASSTSTDSYLLGIAGLTPVTYNWNDEAAKLYSKDKTMANIGLIAQDVEAAFPELVSSNDEGYKQVNFTALQFYVIEAVKELWAKVQGHDERLTKLEQENKDLKDRLSNIENKMDIQPPTQPAEVTQSAPATSTPSRISTSTPPEVVSPPQSEASTIFSLVPGTSQ